MQVGELSVTSGGWAWVLIDCQGSLKRGFMITIYYFNPSYRMNINVFYIVLWPVWTRIRWWVFHYLIRVCTVCNPLEINSILLNDMKIQNCFWEMTIINNSFEIQTTITIDSIILWYEKVWYEKGYSKIKFRNRV